MKFDGGDWKYHRNKTPSSPTHSYFVENTFSEHDIRLYINGNLNDELAQAYGLQLADWLNGPAELVNTIQNLKRQNLELERVNHEQRLQIKRLETALARLRTEPLPYFEARLAIARSFALMPADAERERQLKNFAQHASTDQSLNTGEAVVLINMCRALNQNIQL